MTTHCPDCGAALAPGADECANCPWSISMLREEQSHTASSEALRSFHLLKLALAVAGILAAGYLWINRVPGGSAGFDPDRDATADIAAAVSEARRSGRRVFIEVGGDWCDWCHRLQAFFAAQPEIKNLLETRFVVVKVSVSTEKPNSVPLAKFPQVPGYPHFFVLGPDGALLTSQISDDFEVGGETYDPVKFRAFLMQWAEPR